MENALKSGTVCLLLDIHTRLALSQLSYETLTRHLTILTDIRELSKDFLDSTFIFLEPAVPAVVTPELLEEYTETYRIESIFLCSSHELAELFKNICTVYEVDYSNLNWNLIYAVLNKDFAILEVYQKMLHEPLEYAKLVDGLPLEAQAPVNQMYNSYIFMAGQVARLVDETARQKEMIANYRSVGEKTVQAIEELKHLLDEATKKNEQYCALCSESYDVLFQGLFIDRPRVLYIKEISHISGIDSLISVLYSVITTQLKSSVKVVKLVDSSDTRKIRYVPNVYTKISDIYNTADILESEFLLVLSGYNVLFNLLFLNRSGLNVLIIHDERASLNDAIDGSLVDLRINEVSSDYVSLGEYENIISNMKGVPFYWSNADVASLTGTNSLKLTGHPTVRKILDLLL